MAFLDDFLDGVQVPFKYVFSKVDHVLSIGDRVLDAGANVATGIGDILSGNSNILLYLGIGLIGVLVLPKVIDHLF